MEVYQGRVDGYDKYWNIACDCRILKYDLYAKLSYLVSRSFYLPFYSTHSQLLKIKSKAETS